MIVRLATPHDLPALEMVEDSAVTLFDEVGLEFVAALPPIDPELLERLAGEKTLWVGVDAADKPVGFLAAHELDGRFHILELSVARDWQKQGIGQSLIEVATSHARYAGFDTLSLTTYRDVPWNGPYYFRRGFRELDPEIAGAGHVEELRRQAESGHDMTRRCVMVLPCKG